MKATTKSLDVSALTRSYVPLLLKHLQSQKLQLLQPESLSIHQTIPLKLNQPLKVHNLMIVLPLKDLQLERPEMFCLMRKTSLQQPATKQQYLLKRPGLPFRSLQERCMGTDTTLQKKNKQSMNQLYKPLRNIRMS